VSTDNNILRNLRTLGSLLDDLELARIQNGNRIGALQREFGDALPQLLVIDQQVQAVEHTAELELVRMWRAHPLAPWAKNYRGLGEKSIARLIAVIGDPNLRPTENGYEPRTVAQLRAYCGHGDPNRSHKRKGMTQAELFKAGNPEAKKRVYLIAEAMLKAGNREEYDRARVRYAEAVHESPCARCGPAGHPALPGSPLSDGHKHARALRATGKKFLEDLWLAAGELK
jgi:hypothetical protein